MVKVNKKDKKLFEMYPKPAMSLDRFYGLSVGQKVITRYMGPGIIIYPPIRYDIRKLTCECGALGGDDYEGPMYCEDCETKVKDKLVKRTIYRDTALIKLSRKCWDHLDEQEFPFYELTTNSYGYGD